MAKSVASMALREIALAVPMAIICLAAGLYSLEACRVAVLALLAGRALVGVLAARRKPDGPGVS